MKYCYNDVHIKEKMNDESHIIAVGGGISAHLGNVKVICSRVECTGLLVLLELSPEW